MQELYDDNVMYFEERGLLADVYSGDQTQLKAIEILKIREEVVNKFKAEHPDFWGGKYIYAPHRFHTSEQLSQKLEKYCFDVIVHGL
ncbi:unnamed protein product [Allacma fusca]|uniref:Uncharacterized protein n=2 Tax=Allacma fusca TaxID=39272 RepID=A0A8J2JL41_9HEXA|nr:unnamed protein product [Allacma fusca]